MKCLAVRLVSECSKHKSEILYKGFVHTILEKILKRFFDYHITQQIFFIHTAQIYKRKITGHFGFVFEETSVRETDHTIIAR